MGKLLYNAGTASVAFAYVFAGRISPIEGRQLKGQDDEKHSFITYAVC